MTDATTIARISRAEAPGLAELEYRRFVDLLRTLRPDDWTCRTDCPDWDVREMTLHVLGACEACASFREQAHQILIGKRTAKDHGGSELDAMNALQVRDRDHLTPEQAIAQLDAVIPKAVKGRSSVPGPARRINVGDGNGGPLTLGWLRDVIYTRDTWMHRVEVTRAVGRQEELVLTPEHDGRLVADVVAQWASEHGKPFDLVLEGPAGGHFRQGTGGESIRMDAVEFMRTMSGREAGTGVLAHTVLF